MKLNSPYYPFGMQISERTWEALENGYRFGFNGKERDDEVSGSGNQYDYGFRIYNPRLGKFLSVDPLYKSFPWYTPFQYASNTPIMAIDIDGLEAYIVTLAGWDASGKPIIEVVVDNDKPFGIILIQKYASMVTEENVPLPERPVVIHRFPIIPYEGYSFGQTSEHVNERYFEVLEIEEVNIKEVAKQVRTNVQAKVSELEANGDQFLAERTKDGVFRVAGRTEVGPENFTYLGNEYVSAVATDYKVHKPMITISATDISSPAILSLREELEYDGNEVRLEKMAADETGSVNLKDSRNPKGINITTRLRCLPK